MAEIQATKPKWVSREARQGDIVSAAIDSIARVGFADTTLATVAREAGMSPASVVFYFKTKEALLTETLRHLAGEYSETWKSALAKAPDDPVARLVAIVTAAYSPKVCNRKRIAVWHAFYGEAKTRPDYLRICGQNDDERHRALVDICAGVLAAGGKPTDGARDIATMIDALADGLWTDILTSAGTANRQESLRLALIHLKALLPDSAADIAAWERRV
jgi:TetR/AcrR family transcriptional regulator, transcriptional repressor of bet genes